MTAHNLKHMACGFLLLLPVHGPLARDEGGHSGKPGVERPSAWSYQGDTGPAHWASLSKGFAECGSGKRQSPIDINATDFKHLPKLSFHYRTSVLSMKRRPQGIWLDYDSGSYLKIRDKRYKLKGFDFHTPGEHAVRGRVSDMEIQLHHTGADGERLIVAIPVVAGHRKNVTLTKILEQIPAVGRQHYNRRTGINPLFLLPADRSYFFYQGSETRPPCSENVDWVVFARPVDLDRHDVDRLRALLGNNARPIQPINRRVILTNAR